MAVLILHLFHSEPTKNAVYYEDYYGPLCGDLIVMDYTVNLLIPGYRQLNLELRACEGKGLRIELCC